MIVVARRPLAAVATGPLGTPTSPTPLVGGITVTSITTASFTPSANALLFAHTGHRAFSTINGATVSGGGLTWVPTILRSHDLGGGTLRLRQRVYVAATGPSPSAMTVTMTCDGVGRLSLQILELTGTTAIPTNFATGATDGLDQTAGDPVSTLPATPASSSMLLAFFAGANSSQILVPPPSGFTEVSDEFHADGQVEMQTCYQATGGAQITSFATSMTLSFGNVIEVPQGAALGVPTVPTPAVGANSSSVTSAAFDPPANSLLLACLFNRASAALAASSILDNAGGAITWTLLSNKSYDPGSGTRARVRVYGTILGPSPPTGLTVTNQNAAPRCSLQLLSITGPTALPTNFDPDDGVPNSTSLGGDPVSTLPVTPSAASYILTLMGGTVASALPSNPPTGGATYVELEDAYLVNGASQLQACYSTGGTLATATWSTTQSGVSISCAIEVPQP